EPGTGKTTMMQNHLIDMTKNINCTYNADPIYVRSPHSQWWNGYDNQPIVMIDDANGVNDPTILGRMVSEFQAMKTSAKMRLEMPRLEEKNAEMTSIVLGICSNVKEWTS
nr:Helicase [Opsiphanes invirae iflavirus 1]